MRRTFSKYFWIRQVLYCSVLVLQSVPAVWLALWGAAAGVLSTYVDHLEHTQRGTMNWEAMLVRNGIDVRRLLIGFVFFPIPFVLIGWWLVSNQFDSPNFGLFLGLYCFFTSMVLSMSVRSTSEAITLTRAPK